MQISLLYNNSNYQIDLDQFVDISIPISNSDKGVKAWYVGKPDIEPVRDGDFVGEVAQGSSVNFRNINFNPHAHGTHTECMGHISETIHSVNQNLKQYYFVSELISIVPEEIGEDNVITEQLLKKAFVSSPPVAVIIRTLPNEESKLEQNYSHTNPTYIDYKAIEWLKNEGVEHILIDTPSVDREEDEGQLKAHKAFWNYPNTDRLHCTITEFVYIPNRVNDGLYFMNLQTAPFENDATPSRPILHKMTLTK